MRDPITFTPIMKQIAQALYGHGGEMTPKEIGQSIFPKMTAQQLTGALRALRVSGWAVRRKETTGREQYGHRSFPTIIRWYRLTAEGRRAWSDYLIESQMHRKRTVTRDMLNDVCEHDWLNHYSAENGDLPDARLCLACGKYEQLIRPTRFPDLRDQLINQSLLGLDSVERASWRERAWSMLLQGCRNITDFIFFRH